MTKKRLLIHYIINQSLHWFIFGLTYAIIRLYYLERGLTLLQIGNLVAVWAVFVVVFELPTGGLADAIGRKKLYLISLLVFLISTLLLIFARSLFIFYIVVFFEALARALSSGSMDAWFVDEFRRLDKNGNLQKNLAITQIFIPLALGLSTILGGVFPDLWQKTGIILPGKSIYGITIWMSVFFALIQIALTMVLIKENYQPQGNIKTGITMLPQIIKDSITYGLKQQVIALLLLGAFFFAIGFVTLEIFWQPFVKNLMGNIEGKIWIFGLIGGLYFAASALGNVIITPICKLFKNNYFLILVILFFLIATGFVFISFQKTVLGFTVFYVIIFMLVGMMDSPFLTLFHDNIPENKRSTLLSFHSLIIRFGVLGGSALGGYVSQNYSTALSWQIASGFLLLSTFTLAILLIKKTVNEKKEKKQNIDILNTNEGKNCAISTLSEETNPGRTDC
ncbi:MAG: MFS transporter [Spirochaetes bacterium]|nr:MFS transporter [Spirochaetota bacterium]